jgi:RHH-type transcriptional regulator, rel operon repressor / antitoxin RelB
MLGVRLPDHLEQRLNMLAEQTHRSKSFYIREALEQYLEDKEDYLLAVAALEEFEKSGKKTISLEELSKQLKLDD